MKNNKIDNGTLNWVGIDNKSAYLKGDAGLKRNCMVDIYDKYHLINNNQKQKYSYGAMSSKIIINCIIGLILLTILLTSIPFTSALGITPGRTTLNFEPNLKKEISFSVINDEHKDMSVVFYIRGSLNQSIKMKKTYEEFSAGEESKSFVYEVHLPNKFDKPGKYEAEIIALEMPKNLKQEGTFVGATIAVVTQLYVYVPYPGKYAEAELNTIQKDGKIIFFIPTTNQGELDIVNAKATIDVYTALNEKVATIATDEKSIKSKEKIELIAEWTQNVAPGPYRAVATLTYDGETKQLEKNFDAGEMLVEIEKIEVKDFKLGEIAKFNILVNNKWSDELKDVYVKMDVYNEKEEVMAEIKSPTYNMKSLSKLEMTAYWDTGGVKANTYDSKLYIRYGDKSSEKNIKIKVTETQIEVIGFTGMAISTEKGEFNLQSILIIAVIILIIINIAWFIIFKRMQKKKKGYVVSMSGFLLFDFILIGFLLIKFVG